MVYSSMHIDALRPTTRNQELRPSPFASQINGIPTYCGCESSLSIGAFTLDSLM
jgi:hypothetical protein